MPSSISASSRARALHCFLGKQGKPTAGQLELYQGVFDHCACLKMCYSGKHWKHTNECRACIPWPALSPCLQWPNARSIRCSMWTST